MLQISQGDTTVHFRQCLWSLATNSDSRLHHAGSLSILLFSLSVDQRDRLVSIDALTQADKVGQTDRIIQFVTGSAATSVKADQPRWVNPFDAFMPSAQATSNRPATNNTIQDDMSFPDTGAVTLSRAACLSIALWPCRAGALRVIP